MPATVATSVTVRAIDQSHPSDIVLVLLDDVPEALVIRPLGAIVPIPLDRAQMLDSRRRFRPAALHQIDQNGVLGEGVQANPSQVRRSGADVAEPTGLQLRLRSHPLGSNGLSQFSLQM